MSDGTGTSSVEACMTGLRGAKGVLTLTLPRAAGQSGPAPLAPGSSPGHRVRHVVMPSRPVINAVLPAPGRPAFQAEQLGDEAGVVQQFHPTAVHERE